MGFSFSVACVRVAVRVCGPAARAADAITPNKSGNRYNHTGARRNDSARLWQAQSLGNRESVVFRSQMASRSRWRSRRPAVWPPRLEQATIVETAKAAPQDDPSTRAGQGSRKTIRRVLWRWEQPQSHRSPRMHTIWSSGRNRESYQRPLVQLPRTARYPLLWDIHSMVRPRVQRHADEKPSILGDAAAFGCANWWHAHSIGRRPAFVWTAPAPAQR